MHKTGVQGWEGYQSLLQFHLCGMHIVALDICMELLQEKGMFASIELCPASDICDQEASDNTQGSTVLWGR